MLTVREINGHAKKLGLAHERALFPLSKETGISHTALGILLFFANNPDFATATEVCELRGLKRSIVSTHIERMVSDGLLERKAYPGDRRKQILVPTEKAKPIIDKGRAIQEDFSKSILHGLSEEELAVMEHCIKIMDKNIDALTKNDLSLSGKEEQ